MHGPPPPAPAAILTARSTVVILYNLLCVHIIGVRIAASPRFFSTRNTSAYTTLVRTRTCEALYLVCNVRIICLLCADARWCVSHLRRGRALIPKVEQVIVLLCTGAPSIYGTSVDVDHIII